MAFFTLLERKVLGYIQLRKGPNKVGITGLPQPFADAIKLFAKELNKPTLANIIPFISAPILGLFLALILWNLFPHSGTLFYIKWGVILFLCVSRINVYTTLFSGWASNSKYALLGALRRIAQTISYEVRIALIILSPLIIMSSLRFNSIADLTSITLGLMIWPLAVIWFASALAETNRTPFDLAEGESELVSGFNTEYSSGTFALIFIAEYINIIVIRLFSMVLFSSIRISPLVNDCAIIIFTIMISFLFIWARGAYPRIRYDKLIALTWKIFLPVSLWIIVLVISIILWYCAGMNGQLWWRWI